MWCEPGIQDWSIGVGELSIVLCQKLANMACVTVNRGGFDEDVVDGVPKGKVLGI